MLQIVLCSALLGTRFVEYVQSRTFPSSTVGIVDDGDPIIDNRINAFIVQDDAACFEDLDGDQWVGVSDVPTDCY
tara:strand:+ start:51 stop:275 length:225 start_codon:yes stop_codon:yes gene_type:complete